MPNIKDIHFFPV